MKVHLQVWRQKNKDSPGKFANYTVNDTSPDMSFMEMLDILNEELVKKGEEAIEFDNDCREGICGSCGCVINGQPHGPKKATTTCQLHMRSFNDGDTIVIEPWRSKAFPVIKDLVVNREAFDRIISSGGYVSTKTGKHPDGNDIPIGKDIADKAMDAAACIGCGACVAACPNASAALFTSAKISQMALLPQGQVEAKARAVKMVTRMDHEGFGNCTNIGECHAACPKEISIDHIARMKREFLKAIVSP